MHKPHRPRLSTQRRIGGGEIATHDTRMNIDEFRNATRDYLKSLKGVVPAPPRYARRRRLPGNRHPKMEIALDGPLPLCQTLRYLLNVLSKPRNPRLDLITRGEELLDCLERYPELRTDVYAMREYVQAYADAFQAVRMALQAFTVAADDCIGTQLDILLGSDREDILRRIAEDRRSESTTCGVTCSIRRVLAKQRERKLHLRWRELGEMLVALPESEACLDALRAAVEVLGRRMAELPFCACAPEEEVELPTPAVFDSLWKNFWKSKTETDEFIAWYDDILVELGRMCRFISDYIVQSAGMLEREFFEKPVSQYNRYYDPQGRIAEMVVYAQPSRHPLNSCPSPRLKSRMFPDASPFPPTSSDRMIGETHFSLYSIMAKDTYREEQKFKERRIVDMCFLLDTTASMQPYMAAVRNSIKTFIAAITAKEGIDGITLTNWRACVCAYRDYETRHANEWMVMNNFTSDIDELSRQLDNLQAKSGGNGEGFLLDALFRVIKRGTTGREEVPQGDKWRSRGAATRCIIVITVAPFRETMSVPGAEGGTVEDIRALMQQERIRLFLFAPEMACLYDLVMTGRCYYIEVEESQDPIVTQSAREKALAEHLGNPENLLQAVIYELADHSTGNPPDLEDL